MPCNVTIDNVIQNTILPPTHAKARWSRKSENVKHHRRINKYCGLLLLERFRVGLLLSTGLVSSQWWILIYMFAVLIHWWVEVLHADRTTSMCIWTTSEPRVRLLQRKTGLSPIPAVIYYWPFQGDASVVVYSNCQCSSAWLIVRFI